MIIAKADSKPKPKNKIWRETAMGTSLEVLVQAMKGGETRIDMLIQLAYELPAPIGAKFVEELKGLKDLFGAVSRGIGTLE